MEEETVKKKRKYLIPTIIFGIIALFLVFVCSVILPVSVSEAIKQVSANSDNQASAAVAAPFIAIFMVLFIFIAVGAAFVSVPLVIVNSLLGVRSYVKGVKIAAIIVDVAYAYVIFVGVFKLIQLIVGA